VRTPIGREFEQQRHANAFENRTPEDAGGQQRDHRAEDVHRDHQQSLDGEAEELRWRKQRRDEQGVDR